MYNIVKRRIWLQNRHTHITVTSTVSLLTVNGLLFCLHHWSKSIIIKHRFLTYCLIVVVQKGNLCNMLYFVNYTNVHLKYVIKHNFHGGKCLAVLTHRFTDSVHGFIYTAWAHITPHIAPRGHMYTSRVYESI